MSGIFFSTLFCIRGKHAQCMRSVVGECRPIFLLHCLRWETGVSDWSMFHFLYMKLHQAISYPYSYWYYLLYMNFVLLKKNHIQLNWVIFFPSIPSFKILSGLKKRARSSDNICCPSNCCQDIWAEKVIAMWVSEKVCEHMRQLGYNI